MFIVWLSKPINVFFIRFVGGAGLTGFLYRPWMSGCTDCCYWATRTPWACACCLSRCHNQEILWTGSKDLPHVFLHGSQRHGTVDAKNQGPTGGVDHRKSDSTNNVVLQLNIVSILIANAITRTRTASWAWGWSFSCSCQYKGELYGSLRERPKHGWLREKRIVRWRKSSLPSCHWKTFWGVHNIPLGNDQAKVGVEEVREAGAHIPVPTREVQLVGQTLITFVAWPTHLVKRFLEQVFHPLNIFFQLKCSLSLNYVN